jgi:hypothetical protein
MPRGQDSPPISPLAHRGRARACYPAKLPPSYILRQTKHKSGWITTEVVVRDESIGWTPPEEGPLTGMIPPDPERGLLIGAPPANLLLSDAFRQDALALLTALSSAIPPPCKTRTLGKCVRCSRVLEEHWDSKVAEWRLNWQLSDPTLHIFVCSKLSFEKAGAVASHVCAQCVLPSEKPLAYLPPARAPEDEYDPEDP